MAGAAVPEARQLPSKEHSLFRQIVKCYESKQYKKGLKAADAVLKKFPEHGETLAMKGLTLNCLERKEEAYDFVRRGLKNDLRSHVCWHVYGLLYRSDREYDEAIKCYKNALRQDKENIQILRDLALLQVQMRDLAGFIDTRHQLLQLKPSNRNNWISFAIAHHLQANHEVAVKVLEAFQGTLEEVPAAEAYEHSEMLLYKGKILEEGGSLKEALAALDESEAQIKDKLGLLELRGTVHLRMQSWDDAEKVYRRLLAANPDNYRYHEGLRAALQLTAGGPDAPLSKEQRSRLVAAYEELQQQYPRSSASFRIPLDFKEGADFEASADAYVRKYLAGGVPSLFSDLKPLYREPAKAAALGRLFKRLLEALQTTGDFPPLPDGSPAGPSHKHPTPETQVWTMFFLAQHADRLGDTGEALSLLDKCLEQAPEIVELHSARTRVLKHAGNPQAAAAAADTARSMDLADRFLNSTAAKWLFRAGEIESAEKTAALFTKDGDQVNNLFDMQCMWYEVESGNAHLRKNNIGKALKHFLAVSKHFADFVEDQFDFHGYCVRKMTLRAYIDMLRMEDRLYQHFAFSRAAWGAIEAYLRLYDAPRKDQKEDDDEAAMANMTPDERKKYKQKRRKEAQRKKKEEEARERAAKEREAAAAAAAAKEKEAKGAGKKAPSKKEDPDPHGEQLAATTDPLGEAAKLVVRLKEAAGHRLRTHVMAFEVYIRRGKLLLALEAVKRALQVADPDAPEPHTMVVRFCQAVQALPPAEANGTDHAPRAVVRRVIEQQTAQLLGSSSLAQFVSDYADRARKSGNLRMQAAALEARAILEPASAEKAAAEFLQGASTAAAGGAAQEDSSEGVGPAWSHEECVAVHALLERIGAKTAAGQWWGQCQERFPWSSHFEGARREELQTPPAAAANGVADSVKDLKLVNGD